MRNENGGKRWKGRKLKQEKSVQICEICGTYSTLRGYLQRPNRSPPRKSVSNRRSKNASNAKNMKKNKRACHRLMTHPRLDFINYIITSKLKSLLKIFLRLLQGNLDSSLSSTDNVQARSQATTLQVALQGSHRSLQTCHAEAVERIDICLE